MGLRFRKSINLGGFRINFSKTGIGYSFGAGGLRFTQKAGGGSRVTASIRGTGISYTHDSSIKSRQGKTSVPNAITSPNVEFVDEGTKIESNLVQSDQNELITKLNDAHNKNRRYKTIKILACVGAVISLCYISESWFALIPFLGCIIWFCLLPKKASIDVEYNFAENDSQCNKYNDLLRGLEVLTSNEKLCEITSIQTNADYKKQAGANNLISTSAEVKVGKKMKCIETNIEYKTLKIQNKEIVFLPDIILVYQEKNWKSINYTDVEVAYADSRFIEEGVVPSDTEILTYNWQYMNKNGGPDKRFANNRQIPVCAYGQIGIESKNGLKIIIMGSNRNKTKKFYDAMAGYIK